MKKMLVLIPVAAMLFAFSYVGGPWIAPTSAKKIKNPVPSNKRASSAKAGKKIFAGRCVACHGKSGKGDGAASKALNPKPANLTSAKVQKQTDGEIFWKMTNGNTKNSAMPSWKASIPAADRWKLVNYIRSIKAK